MTIQRRVNFRQGHQSVRKQHLHEKLNWMSWEGAKRHCAEMAVLGCFLDRRDRATSLYEKSRSKNPEMDKQLRTQWEELRKYAHIASLLKQNVARKYDWSLRDVDIKTRPIATCAMSELDHLDMVEVFKNMETDEAKMAYEMYNST